MKRILLLSVVLIFGITTFAQMNSMVPKSLQNKRMDAPVKIDNLNFYAPLQQPNYVANSKSTLDETIGASRYDMQSNGSIRQELVFDPSDNTMMASWTRGMSDPSYADRGTGYNYFNGTAWGTAPTARIESMKTGWGAVLPWNGGGELCIAHQSAVLPLVMNTRPVKGTGSWTQTTIPMPAGVSGVTWHRVITSGPTNNYIHIIVLTGPTANGGTAYNGLDGALLYYRSLDGGTTWDKLGIQIDPLTSANYVGFGGDDYAWGTPHGDTLVFAVGGNWTDTFIMKSYNNGETWEKVQILSNANTMNIATNYAPPFYCADGTIAVEMDHEGVFHVAFGRMRATDDGSGHKYFPGTDGLVYWNSTMPPVADSLDPTVLENAGQLLGFVYSDGNPNDTIVAFPAYGVGLTSFPQISIDEFDNVYAIWSGVTVGNPDPNGNNYRHTWHRFSTTHGQTWSDSNDLCKGLTYIYKEFAYASMAKTITNNKLRILYQTADIAGSNIKDATVAVHDVSMDYREYTDVFTGTNDKPAMNNNVVSQNNPNPFKGNSVVYVNVEKPANLSLEVYNLMGQKIMSINKGSVNTGVYPFTIDGSQLSSGVYFYTVKINNQSYTHKMIVE
jgi:hypothetical protein